MDRTTITIIMKTTIEVKMIESENVSAFFILVMNFQLFIVCLYFLQKVEITIRTTVLFAMIPSWQRVSSHQKSCGNWQKVRLYVKTQKTAAIFPNC